MLQVTNGTNIDCLRIDILEHSSYYMMIEEEPDGELWYYDIMSYLKNGDLPQGSEASDGKHLMKLASKFFISGDVLYKRSFDLVLLRCVDAHEANQLIKEIHEGECGPHMNGRLLAMKIMRLGYYLLTMEIDCV